MSGLSILIMKETFYFLGSLVRWMALNPSKWLVFHLYVSFVYFIAFITSSYSFWGDGLILILGVFGPLFYSICNGLPLDCLDYNAYIIKEYNSDLT